MNLERSLRLEHLVGGSPVVGFETTEDGEISELHPGDIDLVAHPMSAKRLGEFAAGRVCVRAGLDELGIDTGPLPIGSGRSPIWPEGVRGSITHTRGFRGAVVVRSDDLDGASIGIDAESVGRVTEKLWDRLFVSPEIEMLESSDDPEGAATIIFSVKEAFYKAQYPFTEAWVGFGDVRVEFTTEGRLVLHPFTDLDALSAMRWPIDARWYRDDALVLTGLRVFAAS